ncbi:MAG: hypothetical protein EBS17_04180 [Flavobacteriia bacterium]|nr:hypothetical protein [Flavobacteriia bacterium]
MMRFLVLISWTFYAGWVLSQNGNDIQRGPANMPADGIIDGVVVKEEVPVRSRIEYEFVRESDYVWSKRIFSRIDAREKANHKLFLPYDKFTKEFTQNPPKNAAEMMDHKGWIRNQSRLSLWSIILQHLMNGDLSMFFVADTNDFNFAKEDGYSFKYRLNRYNADKDKNSYYSQNTNYSKHIVDRCGGFFEGTPLDGMYQGQGKVYMTDYMNYKTFKDWTDNYIKTDYDANNIGAQWQPDIKTKMADPSFEKSWNKAQAKALKTNADVSLLSEDLTFFVSSELITAFNIKEDWFFDKERSVLDKRIIAIAPVAKFTLDTAKVSKRGGLIMIDPYANPPTLVASISGAKTPVNASTPTAEFEMFWLYFPQLRNVMVNYYVYNEQSDALWMSFDDFFWKRLFSGQIYKATDQFDRNIEDYRYGVDALYEAQKIKESMRTWETDLWHY